MIVSEAQHFLNNRTATTLPPASPFRDSPDRDARPSRQCEVSPTMFTQANIRSVVQFLPLSPEVAPLQSLVAGNEAMQIGERGFIQGELASFDQPPALMQ